MPLARQADALTVVDPRRDLDLERPLFEQATGAVARLARVLDRSPGAAAGRTRLRPDELAEHAARHLPQAAGPATCRTRDDRRPRLGPVTAATRARDRDLERHLARRAACSVGQVDLDTCGDVRATTAPRAAGDAEEVVAEERGEQVGQVAEVERRRLEAAAAQAVVPETVVHLTALAVRQNLVGLDDLAETLLRVGSLGDVGVELARETAKRALDFSVVRVARNAE